MTRPVLSTILRRTCRAGCVVPALALASTAVHAQASQTFHACYVPSVGAIYLIKLTGLPDGCLASSHVAFSWSESGSLTDGSVTAVKLADGAVITVKIADGAVTSAKIAGGAVGTAQLADEAVTSAKLGPEAFGGPGDATTVARSDHTHEVGTDVGSNTAVGRSALGRNTSGLGNTAVGAFAMSLHTSGEENTALGANALGDNTAGFNNTAVGRSALTQSTGSNNIGLGFLAGFNLTSGDNNIYIGNGGVSSESNTIRIGSSQTSNFIAGISGQTSASGVTVLVNSDGKLGTTTSSVRAKEAVEDLGEGSRRLLRLRPVQFRYKPEYDDGSRLVQYGLIAEEVAEVFPELAAYRPSGEVETVRYHLFPALLLNELQRQEQELAELRAQLAPLEAALLALEPPTRPKK